MRSGWLIWGGTGLLMYTIACTPTPTDIQFRIEPITTCRDVDVGPIRCVRIKVIGTRGGVACVEGTEKRIPLADTQARIAQVQGSLPKDGMLFDVPAARNYEIEAIGFKDADCFPEPDLSHPFCGLSLPARLDRSTTEPIAVEAVCSDLAVLQCTSIRLSLSPCE
jgi:hypothetical protein